MIFFMLKEGPLDEILSYDPPLLELHSTEFVDKLPSRRILTTHRYPESIPQAVLKNQGKAVLLYRNPKDTAVSLYYHLQKVSTKKYNISWNCHIDNWMKGSSKSYSNTKV